MNGNQDNKSYLLSESDITLIKRAAVQRIAEAAVMDTLRAAGSIAKSAFQKVKDDVSQKVGNEMLKNIGKDLSADIKKAKDKAKEAVGKYVKDKKEAEAIANAAVQNVVSQAAQGGTKTSMSTTSTLSTSPTSK